MNHRQGASDVTPLEISSRSAASPPSSLHRRLRVAKRGRPRSPRASTASPSCRFASTGSGGRRLPCRRSKELDFLIDGRPGWVEHRTPFVYANGGNWLVTSFLTPGMHAFAIRLTTLDGGKSTDTVRARVVAAPAPPAPLVGTWQRTMTADDAKKATSGQPPPPPGLWKITISSKGWVMTDPQGGGLILDVAYLTPTKLPASFPEPTASLKPGLRSLEPCSGDWLGQRRRERDEPPQVSSAHPSSRGGSCRPRRCTSACHSPLRSR